MRYLGVDYGGKRVGIAISDTEGMMAFPHSVIANNSSLVESVVSLARSENVGAIVVGESRTYAGMDNPIMKQVRPFVIAVAESSGVPVYFEPEFLTSREAGHIQGENHMHDAAAAAIILRSYLDKMLHREGRGGGTGVDLSEEEIEGVLGQ